MLGLALAAAAAAVRWRAPIAAAVVPRWTVARLHWLERGCWTSTSAPDLVGYDDTSTPPSPAGDGLYETSAEAFGSASRNVSVWMPGVWKRYLVQVNKLDEGWPVSPADFEASRGISSGIRSRPSGVAFLHERSTPDGRPELMCVRVSGGEAIDLTAYAWRLGSFSRVMGPTGPPDDGPFPRIRLCRDQPTDQVRLFAGQVDPGDPTRFTIAGDDNGRPFTLVGTIGTVGNDGRVTLRQTAGWTPRNDDDTPGSDEVPHLIAGHEEDLA